MTETQTNTEGYTSELSQEAYEEQVRTVINKVRPYLQFDGGDIEIVKFDEKDVYVRLKGACSHCAGATATLKLGVEQTLRDEVPGFTKVIPL